MGKIYIVITFLQSVDNEFDCLWVNLRVILFYFFSECTCLFKGYLIYMKNLFIVKAQNLLTRGPSNAQKNLA